MTSLPDAIAAFARQTAMDQRARLLEAVWDDLEGPQRAVRAGALPARLVSGTVPAPARLCRYAADLTYCPDGEWRVARDYVGAHPGAALLEAPVLSVFLPGLCRLLLGETLRLASLPAWWLGERQAWPLVSATGRRLAIRDALDPNDRPIVLAELPSERRQRLQTLVDADPSRFIAGPDLGCYWPVQHVTHDTVRFSNGLYC